ncbi:hypothetical protein DFP94_11917 [Fontibacillus phaseoli]|uniref:SigmaY antisigma factor component n=1 Tax=Fontibacillus phaseoli TaxID=1416533 RepID=A0A369B0E4_9BACL|nr:hypothetical protein [Fontibacillus phaseoli]RCX13906.1 hypothetical protein DFP94_11917 [Fontibacillus phaseoli]
MSQESLPWGLWVLIALMLLTQGMWIFRDARKRGKEKSAWFWGLWGILNVPTPLIVYLLVEVMPEFRKKRKNGKPPVM